MQIFHCINCLWNHTRQLLPSYLKMLEARASLPITGLKNHFLHLLKENDVIVVSRETGCGKTTQSDFLLIVLKSLVEKPSNQLGRKLKVIIMSATVDSSLFARYFGDCPVISVEGRTHPVSTHCLEDVYEKMEYCLALDSPASGAYFSQHGE